MSEGVIGVRRRRSISEALSLVSEYEASGLSRRLFCASHGLAVATLDLYRKRARQGGVRPRLLTVEIAHGSEAVDGETPGSPMLTVVVRNGRRIEIGGAFDSDLLSKLVGVLEGA